jgi:hypothetical protein
VTTEVTAELGKGFDNELGLEYLELTPDGGRARLEIKNKLLQPWGIVHGGVYCSIVEGLASLSGQVWLLENGDRGVDTDPPGPPAAAVVDHDQRRQGSRGRPRPSAAAEHFARVTAIFRTLLTLMRRGSIADYAFDAA